MNIVILTGAGISAESGVKTFRDQDGLWEGPLDETSEHPKGLNSKLRPDIIWFYTHTHQRTL